MFVSITLIQIGKIGWPAWLITYFAALFISMLFSFGGLHSVSGDHYTAEEQIISIALFSKPIISFGIIMAGLGVLGLGRMATHKMLKIAGILGIIFGITSIISAAATHLAPYNEAVHLLEAFGVPALEGLFLILLGVSLRSKKLKEKFPSAKASTIGAVNIINGILYIFMIVPYVVLVAPILLIPTLFLNSKMFLRVTE